MNSKMEYLQPMYGLSRWIEWNVDHVEDWRKCAPILTCWAASAYIGGIAANVLSRPPMVDDHADAQKCIQWNNTCSDLELFYTCMEHISYGFACESLPAGYFKDLFESMGQIITRIFQSLGTPEEASGSYEEYELGFKRYIIASLPYAYSSNMGDVGIGGYSDYLDLCRDYTLPGIFKDTMKDTVLTMDEAWYGVDAKVAEEKPVLFWTSYGRAAILELLCKHAALDAELMVDPAAKDEISLELEEG